MSTLEQALSLARRSILGTLRQPASLIPALTFPLIFLALMSGAAGPAADIPGFPAPSYFDFVIAGVLVQGALLGGVNSGTSLAEDIEEGFIRRLSLTPMPRPVLLVGHLSGSMVVGAAQALMFVGVGIVFDAPFETGAAGMAVMVGMTMLVALTFSAVGAIIAIRTRSSEQTQSFFPMFFIVLSFSSFFIPRDLITADWFRAIANVNPASYMIEGIRSLFLTGWDAGTLGLGLLSVAGLGALAIAVATRGLRTVMERT